jgi:hypothetical protein
MIGTPSKDVKPAILGNPNDLKTIYYQVVVQSGDRATTYR